MNCFYSIVGRSYEYWQQLYDEGTIEEHKTILQLTYLQYVFDQGMITHTKYLAHHTRISNQKYYQTCTNYKPQTLITFGRLLKMQSSKNKLDIYQPLKTDQYPDDKNNYIQNSVKNPSEDIELQNEAIYNINLGLKSINNQTKMLKKSRKRRKKKKKLNTNTHTNIINGFINTTNIEITKQIEDTSYMHSTKQIATPKFPVKIFVRQVNKNDQSEDTSKNTTKMKSLREIFSKLLKQFKQERGLQL